MADKTPTSISRSSSGDWVIHHGEGSGIKDSELPTLTRGLNLADYSAEQLSTLDGFDLAATVFKSRTIHGARSDDEIKGDADHLVRIASIHLRLHGVFFREITVDGQAGLEVLPGDQTPLNRVAKGVFRALETKLVYSPFRNAKDGADASFNRHLATIFLSPELLFNPRDFRRTIPSDFGHECVHAKSNAQRRRGAASWHLGTVEFLPKISGELYANGFGFDELRAFRVTIRQLVSKLRTDRLPTADRELLKTILGERLSDAQDMASDAIAVAELGLDWLNQTEGRWLFAKVRGLAVLYTPEKPYPGPLARFAFKNPEVNTIVVLKIPLGLEGAGKSRPEQRKMVKGLLCDLKEAAENHLAEFIEIANSFGLTKTDGQR